ncbi:uncharacterized protein G2W53_043484 [Senna tora]|uniref:Uncharacterized protein n=1 Tax=Senna tora TaxID=362788 RepID=A0A834SKT6_9FABA|nr:uncharacterized protein G2W53_043484 [Senna tora]
MGNGKSGWNSAWENSTWKKGIMKWRP